MREIRSSRIFRLHTPELIGLLFFCLLFAATSIWLQREMEVAELHITMSASRDSTTQVYWRETSGRYNENSARYWNIRQHPRLMRFSIPVVDTIDYLRIDPMIHEGTAIMESITVSQSNRKPRDLMPTLKAGVISVLGQGSFSIEKDHLTLTSLGPDPSFEIALTPPIEPKSTTPLIIGSLLFACLTYLLLNQQLIKGIKSSGTLLITTPHDAHLRLPDGLATCIGSHQSDSKAAQAHSSRYSFTLQQVDPLHISTLIGDISRLNPGCSVTFQYNRAGEV